MKRIFILLASIIISSAAYAQRLESPAAHIWERAAYGDKPGITNILLSGYNGSPNTTYEILSPETAAAQSFPSAALTTPYCASSDANDTSAGTGCRSITVTGVNSSFTEFSETINLSGQSSATLLTTNILFFNSVICASAGSNGVNAGIIRCGTGVNTAGVPAVAYTHIAIGDNKTQQYTYAVPSGRTLVCKSPQFSQYNASNHGISLKIAHKTGLTGLVYNTYLHGSSHGGSTTNNDSFTVYPASTMIIGSALASTAAANPISALTGCLLLNNSWVSTSQGIF